MWTKTQHLSSLAVYHYLSHFYVCMRAWFYFCFCSLRLDLGVRLACAGARERHALLLRQSHAFVNQPSL